MKHAVLAFLVLLAVACHKPSAQTFGVVVPGPANPMVPVDPNGNYPAAVTTTGGGGYVTIDGGTVTTATGSVTTLQDSGVTVLNTVSNDPVPASETNALVVQSVPAVQQMLIDAGTRCLLSAAWTNEGMITGYGQVYCGQYALDAGGTAGAATQPSLQVRCPAGTVCGLSLADAPLCCAGAAWYSSVDAGFLLGTSAPALTLTKAALR